MDAQWESSYNAWNAISRGVTLIFRYQVTEFLSRTIKKGRLTITSNEEAARTFGETISKAHTNQHPIARLHLEDASSFYTRIITQGDIGFGESYMAGDFTVTDAQALTTIFHLLILNRDDRDDETQSTPRFLLGKLGELGNGLLHYLNRNTTQGSRRNISAHYDLSNTLFAQFLGSTWTYSCALFGDRESMSLEDAQVRKLDTILEQAHVNAGTTLLDIGCGWGQLAIHAALKYGCKVRGITLSKEQLRLARERAHLAGVSESIHLTLTDYRELAEGTERFDRIVSVEMLEAVGHDYLGDFFSCVEQLLKRDGIVALQVITTPEERYERYRRGTDFIQKHIFPGGLCPSLQALTNAMGTRSKLNIEAVRNIGVHYAPTLREWRRRFCHNVDNGNVAKAGFDDVFVRKWIYYLCYCESGFETRTLNVLQMVLTRVGNVRVLGGSPQCLATPI